MIINKKQFLIDLGYNIMLFKFDVVSKIGNRFGTKSKSIKLALKTNYIPDDFYVYPQLVDNNSVDFVYNHEFNNKI